MSEHNYWQRMSQARLARRAFLRAGGLTAAGFGAAAVVGCGGGTKKSTSSKKTAAPQQPQTGGTLNHRLQTDPATLDVHQASTYGASWPESVTYNQLVQYDPQDPDTKIIPDLADSYEIAGDGSSIVFKLHPGVKFHDGSDFTSADVKANIDWIKGPPKGKPSPRQGVLGTITSVETPDPLTAKVVLSRPTPSLIPNLATNYLAIGAKSDLDKGDLGTNMNGTGPFKLKAYTRGVGLDFEKNPNYWVKDRPYMDGVKFSIVPDENTAFTDFLAGRFQRLYPILPENVSRVADLETQGKAKDIAVVSTLRDYVFFNGGKKPYNDPRVRQAVSLALDRQSAIQVVWRGSAILGGYMVPGGQWALTPDQVKKVSGYDKPDIAEAKKLLSAAGVNEPLSGTIVTRTDQLFRDAATFVQGSLQKAFGWNFQIDAKDSAAGYDAAYKGQFDLVVWTVGITVDDPDATFAEIAISKAVRNWSKVYDTEADALFDKQSQTVNTAERQKLVNQLETKFLNDFQVIGLYFQQKHDGIWNTVQNYKVPSSIYVNQRYQDVWLRKA